LALLLDIHKPFGRKPEDNFKLNFLRITKWFKAFKKGGLINIYSGKFNGRPGIFIKGLANILEP